MRSCLGITLYFLSEEYYDEYGTAAAWKKAHGRECSHVWVVMQTRSVWGAWDLQAGQKRINGEEIDGDAAAP